MGFRVKASKGVGSAVSVIVDSLEAAATKASEYREDGFEAVEITDMDGKKVELPPTAKELYAGSTL